VLPDPLNAMSDLTKANRFSYVGDDPIGAVDPDGTPQAMMEYLVGMKHL